MSGGHREQAEGVKHRLDMKHGEGEETGKERVSETTERHGHRNCRADCTNVCKSKVTGASFKVGTSDTRTVCEPFFSSLESWTKVSIVPFLHFLSSPLQL